MLGFRGWNVGLDSTSSSSSSSGEGSEFSLTLDTESFDIPNSNDDAVELGSITPPLSSDHTTSRASHSSASSLSPLPPPPPSPHAHIESPSNQQPSAPVLCRFCYQPADYAYGQPLTVVCQCAWQNPAHPTCLLRHAKATSSTLCSVCMQAWRNPVYVPSVFEWFSLSVLSRIYLGLFVIIAWSAATFAFAYLALVLAWLTNGHMWAFCWGTACVYPVPSGAHIAVGTVGCFAALLLGVLINVLYRCWQRRCTARIQQQRGLAHFYGMTSVDDLSQIYDPIVPDQLVDMSTGHHPHENITGVVT